MSESSFDNTGAPTTPNRLQIVRAATNDPALSERSVTLGGRTFPVVDLAYDDYLLFLAQLQPLLEAMLGSLPGVRGLGLTEAFSAGTLLKYCGSSLPEMVRIVCSQTAPEITVEEVKKLAKTPFALINAVLAQMEQNKVIEDLKLFFDHAAPILKAALRQRAQ